MTEQHDSNALLLQVMAHDLLAPLTAMKWQIELLGKKKIKASKREQHQKGIADSVELGIALTKHAHAAAKVLTHTYQSDKETGQLATTIQQAIAALRMQYDRHGLLLQSNLDEESSERTCDSTLIGLLVWAMAKFFLTFAPAGTTVDIKGVRAPKEKLQGTYTLVFSVEGMPNQEECLQAFSAEEARGDYDQAHVFATLIRKTATLLGVEVVADTHTGLFAIEATFPTTLQ